MKKTIIVGLCFSFFLLLLVCMVAAGGGGEEESSGNVSIEGLPSWITVDMVAAAVEMQKESGYPASVVLGQMILEAGATGSVLANPPYYNCLGQKSPSFGEIGVVTMNTAEAWGYEDAGFSTFASYVDCMRAWGHKFTMAPYVDHVLTCPKKKDYYNPDAFIMAVWKSGYATDPAYVGKVIALMESYGLYRFNDMSVEQVKALGTGGGVVIVGNGIFTHPCPGMTMQTSYFGEIREFEVGGHKGNDYAAPVGTPTYAAADGVVTVSGWSDSAGYWVVIDHGGGLVTKYMHHSRLTISQGVAVRKGQQIGEVGSTGMSTGPHLHFQVEEDGVPVSPDKYL